jgi:predicted naringenin-chalcone synthase
MGLAVLGMGTAVPPHRVSREQALEAAKVLANCDTDQAAALTALYNHTDIASRHMVFGKDVLRDVVQGTNETGSPFVPCGPASRGPDTAERMRVYQREALPLALEASQGALREGGLDPADVSHLVTVSCTGFAAPGFDIGLIKSLHLRPTVGRTHIGFMGCHGAFNALRVARAAGRQRPFRRRRRRPGRRAVPRFRPRTLALRCQRLVPVSRFGICPDLVDRQLWF